MELPFWSREGLTFLNAEKVLVPDTCHIGTNPKFCIAGEEEGVCAEPFQACDPIRGNELCIHNPDWTEEVAPTEPTEETAPETPAEEPAQ